MDEDHEKATPIEAEFEFVADFTLINSKGFNIVEFLQKDQLKVINSLVDAHIVCQDGHVPFHRYVLMGASRWINEILINEDPSQLAVIYLPDVKVQNAVQVISALYTGKAVYSKSNKKCIYEIFKMLGINCNGLQFENSTLEDTSSIHKLRFYEKESKSENDCSPNSGILENEGDNVSKIPEVEVNVVNETDFHQITEQCGRGNEDIDQSKSSTHSTVISENQIDILQKSKDSEIACVDEDHMDGETNEDDTTEEHHDFRDGVMPYRGPRVTSIRQIDRAETVKFKSMKMRLSQVCDENGTIENNSNIKCCFCDQVYQSDEGLSEHLIDSCGSHLSGKYLFHNKQCLGCRESFPIYNIIDLINHVDSCKAFESFSQDSVFEAVKSIPPPPTLNETLEIILAKEEAPENNVESEEDEDSNPSVPIPNKKAKTGFNKKPKNCEEINKNQKNAIPIENVGLTTETVNDNNYTEIVLENGVQKNAEQDMQQEFTSNPKQNDKGVIHEKEVTSPAICCNTTSSSSSSEKCMKNGENNDNEEITNSSDIAAVVQSSEEAAIKGGCCKDISELSNVELKRFLMQCPVCKKKYKNHVAASKCLRINHALRYCWMCLELVSINHHKFLQHNLKHIIPRSNKKVYCPFCKKAVQFMRGIDIHCRYHFATRLRKKKKIKNKPGNTAAAAETINSSSIRFQRGPLLVGDETVLRNSFQFSSRDKIEEKSGQEGQSIGNLKNNSNQSMESESPSSEEDDRDPDFDLTESDMELVRHVHDRQERPITRNCPVVGQNNFILSAPATSTNATVISLQNQNDHRWTLLAQEIDDIQSNFSNNKS